MILIVNMLFIDENQKSNCFIVKSHTSDLSKFSDNHEDNEYKKICIEKIWWKIRSYIEDEATVTNPLYCGVACSIATVNETKRFCGVVGHFYNLSFVS